MNFFLPITPATTGPVPMPMRRWTLSPVRSRYSATCFCISSAIIATASAKWICAPASSPAAAM
jgi:hypothetical protein